jgi:hypothetical protein
MRDEKKSTATLQMINVERTGDFSFRNQLAGNVPALRGKFGKDIKDCRNEFAYMPITTGSNGQECLRLKKVNIFFKNYEIGG